MSYAYELLILIQIFQYSICELLQMFQIHNSNHNAAGNKFNDLKYLIMQKKILTKKDLEIPHNCGN